MTRRHLAVFAVLVPAVLTLAIFGAIAWSSVAQADGGGG